MIPAVYTNLGFKLVFWPTIGDTKGPRDPGWPTKVYDINKDYHDGYRVGVLTGTEISPGKFLHDVDIDWAEGAKLALRLLPTTHLVFGRASKKISHCFYTCPEPGETHRFEDIDGKCLIEFRGTKKNGEIGCQTMVPPSIWSDDEHGKPREQLEFVKEGIPDYYELDDLVQRVTLAAIGMLLARHLGTNGFGHEVRLAWAGFLLKLSIEPEDLILMGEAISGYCNNLEVGDVRTAVESTVAKIQAKGKIKAGPALSKMLGDNGKKVLARIYEWLGKASDYIRDQNGQIIKDSQENIRRAFVILGVELSYNEFAERKLQGKVHLEDPEVNELYLRMDEECRFKPSFQFFERVMNRVVFTNHFHPVLDYLNSLVWDGKKRIDSWLEVYGAVKPGNSQHAKYLKAVSGIVLVAAVRRIRHPGCKFDEMLVLESKQGWNKSSALRTLVPNEEWFSDDFPLHVSTQKLLEATKGKWIIEASDLAGKKKADIEQLKAMMSRQIDGARMSYGREPTERKRRFILVGTTNSDDYLTDPTGARRFWPVECGRFNLDALARDRDQLWAEACASEAGGFSIRLSENLWEIAGEEQDKRHVPDEWEDKILGAIQNAVPHADGRVRLASEALWDTLMIELPRRDRLAQNRLGDVMRRHGFRHTKIYLNKETVSGYIGPQTELDLTTLSKTEKDK